MRKFTVDPFEFEVDLDDPKTYRYLPNDVKLLRAMLHQEIGYYYCYVNYWHPDWDGPQEARCEKLIQNYTANWRDNMNNVLWFQEQVFIFQSEIENMC